MLRSIVLLSGPIAAGKTALGDDLIREFGAFRYKTNEFITRLKPGIELDRRQLQIARESLDRKTRGQWLAQELGKQLAVNSAEHLIVVDAVRTTSQVEAVRQSFGKRVVHIHLTASLDVLAARYARRDGALREVPQYSDLQASKAERQIEKLSKIADMVLNTDRCSRSDVLVRVAARLELYQRTAVPLVDVLVGGQYGSEGKGHIVSYLASEYDYLVRVGGPNAGHKVYEEPEPYTFHQLPSGTRHSEAKLIIGPGAYIRIPTLLKEIAECKVSYDRLFIDPQATIISDADVENERRKLKDKIGSTAQGVGAAASRRINERSTKKQGSTVVLAKDVKALKPYLRETRQVLDCAYARKAKILLEGTQGTFLSLYHGYYPHVTSRDTTVSGCLAEAGIAPAQVRRTIMVCRTYPIRVGNARRGSSGYMSQELDFVEISRRSGIPLKELQSRERTSTTDRPRRIAEFDWRLLKDAVLLNRPTDIALTFVDYLSIDNRDSRRFEQLSDYTIHFIEEIERVSGVPVTLISTRFHTRSIIDRRSW